MHNDVDVGDQSRADQFWSRANVVEKFAGRDPDLRLISILEDWVTGRTIRALDLGCAGGRNTEALTRAGADVHAIDRSHAMVERTRSRLTGILGREEAERRVGLGSMRDLSRFGDEGFDLVVALGVYGSAGDREVFQETLSETARILVPGGRALVATFSPGSQPEGVPLSRHPKKSDVYTWRGGRRAFLLEPEALDHAFARHGLLPHVPTSPVHVDMERGFRITINALYRKLDPAGS